MLVSSRGVDPRPRRIQGSSAAQVEVAPAGVEGVLQAAVQPLHHPIGLGVLGSCWLVLKAVNREDKHSRR
jgi:hypothetical protein